MWWITAKDFDRNEKVSAVTKLYNEMGIDKLALDKIAHYFDESRHYLDAVKVDDSRKAMLRQYAEKMMNRKY
jgi:geranylgeranyl diphosphate synthase type II